MLYCACGLCCACSYRRELMYYRCCVKEGQEWKRPCATRFHVRVDVLDALVWHAVESMLLNEENLRQGIEEQQKRTQSDMEHLYKQLEAVIAARVDTERKVGILLEQLLDGDFPKSIINERKKLLLDKLTGLEHEELKLQVELSSSTITPEKQDFLLDFAATIRRSIQDLSFEEKRNILQMLTIRVDVLSKSVVKISGLLTFPDDVLDVESFVSTLSS
jgi:hypothetical protein